MIKGIYDDILKRVYDFSEMTDEELRCKFFQKLQECIDLCNNTNGIAQWIKEEGIEKEVNEILTMWLNDGTLEKMINTNLIDIVKSELMEEINNIKNDIEEIKEEIKALKNKEI